MITRLFVVFITTFIVILILNQFAYGSCFKIYCLKTAVPSVFILSSLVTALIIWGDSPEANQSEITKDGNKLSKSHKSNSYSKWENKEERQLIVLLLQGKSKSEIGVLLSRSKGAVTSRINKITEANMWKFKSYTEAIESSHWLEKKFNRTVKVFDDGEFFYIDLDQVKNISDTLYPTAVHHNEKATPPQQDKSYDTNISYFLEIAGIQVEFSPTNLTISTYVYDELEEVLCVNDIADLRSKYSELLNEGYKQLDKNEIIGIKPILEPTPEEEAIRQAKIEALEREEFFTAKPDDWANK